MSTLFSMKSGLILAVVSIFALSTWSVQSNTLFTMKHHLEKVKKNRDGSMVLSFNIELTNNSTSDLSAIELIAITTPSAVLVNPSKLRLETLPSGETATMNWMVITHPSLKNWQQPQLTFTGHALEENQKSVSLTITSLDKNS